MSNAKQHDPLSDEPALMSEDKRSWWASPWTNPQGVKTPTVAVFHYGMNGTVRPSDPSETIALSYMRGFKFHDREPQAVLDTILKLAPGFFDTYPRKEGTELDAAFMKAAIGEAARAFYRHGLSAYGKPGLRKQVPPPPSGAPTAII